MVSEVCPFWIGEHAFSSSGRHSEVGGLARHQRRMRAPSTTKIGDAKQRSTLTSSHRDSTDRCSLLLRPPWFEGLGVKSIYLWVDGRPPAQAHQTCQTLVDETGGLQIAREPVLNRQGSGRQRCVLCTHQVMQFLACGLPARINFLRHQRKVQVATPPEQHPLPATLQGRRTSVPVRIIDHFMTRSTDDRFQMHTQGEKKIGPRLNNALHGRLRHQPFEARDSLHNDFLLLRSINGSLLRLAGLRTDSAFLIPERPAPLKRSRRHSKSSNNSLGIFWHF